MAFHSESFQVTDDGVRFLFFFIEKTIPFSEVKSIRCVPFWRAFFEGMNPFRPPMYSTGVISLKVVLLETKKNWLIAGGQRNGEEFVKLVSNRLSIPNEYATRK